MGSQAGFAALPTESVYCMTKAGISHLTKCLAVEWGKYNITVNAVAPTFIATPGTDEFLANPAARADVIERIRQSYMRRDPAVAERNKTGDSSGDTALEAPSRTYVISVSIRRPPAASTAWAISSKASLLPA